MNFLKTPNLPQRGAVALVDNRCGSTYCEALEKLGINLVLVPPSGNLYDAVSAHPDMAFHDLGEGNMIYEPAADTKVLKRLKDLGVNLIEGSSGLLPQYPKSVSYNAARVGDFVFHNFKYTDSILLQEIEKRALKKIHVNQGYSKCSICIVDENSIITADTGIHRAATDNGIDSLLIPPQEKILLKGLDYGFIGGSTGKISEDMLCIFGNIEKLTEWEKIISFVEERDVKVVSLGHGAVEDFGSLIIIGEK